jgi:hypothetical protein
VAIEAWLVAALEQHLSDDLGPAADALLFTSREVRPLGRTKFRVNPAATGIEPLHFHAVRGSGTTWLATEAGPSAN